ncbi:MAG: YbaB/EbfC family nucleoid-associated protein [Planctomycetes bacterium]|nr:YbaB/EbfC family nucleoid-associated protein [Planctomycetota bacterium]
MSGLGEMGNLLKQAQEMQRQLDAVRAELRARAVEGLAAGGAVRVVLSADRHEVRGVHLAAGAPVDPRALEEALGAALRDALRRAADAEREAIGRVTGGMNLPGLL